MAPDLDQFFNQGTVGGKSLIGYGKFRYPIFGR